VTFRDFLAKQRKQASIAALFKSMPNVKTWAEVRSFLNKQEATEDQLVAARGLWPKFQDRL
jgi:hypothetical protein